ncbi:sodium/calcium exchanger 2-like isoform X2 [Gigantopelta aegis]|uniref:sodium/calcium exchanger 2-like isoform X2 n=1 Tax=Gigantopelta aegis TaxID=1735272 RepID=UPI001B88D102|nr:sodium/calcium exchanger 2-like isoform X2 [Gigantopelta aegis]
MAMHESIQYYSNGYVVEILANNKTACSSWLLLPAENLWPDALRGFLYVLAMMYLFMGIAIASDVFMCSIEVLTSKKRIIVRWDEEKQEKVEREILVWNETVANLTLMALGSSAPEILLATIEAITRLGSTNIIDALGTFTIIGSAAFNLLIITAICVVTVPTPNVKRIKEFGVFLLTSVWSIWAYLWMLLVVKFISPGVIEIWEAFVTLGFFPTFVIMAYCQDNGWWLCRSKRVAGVEEEEDDNVRIVMGNRRPSMLGHVPKELHVLEAEKAHRMSIVSLHSLNKGRRSTIFEERRLSRAAPNLPPLRGSPSCNQESSRSESGIRSEWLSDTESDGRPEEEQSPPLNRMIVRKSPKEPQTFARARSNRNSADSDTDSDDPRFRHAAVSTLMGGAKLRSMAAQRNPRMADVVAKMQTLHEAVKQGKPPEGDLVGKFTFASDRYAVLESAGNLQIDVLFHRQILSKSTVSMLDQERVIFKNGNVTIPSSGNLADTENEPATALGVVSVDYETREGSAKPGKDFKFSKGTLIFKETEYQKSFSVSIINDNQYEADVDFYIILKNPKGMSGLGDPSVARVTIVDDDEPGEFSFEEGTYHADMKTAKVTVKVIREHGFDGKVKLEYSTFDGTGIGGSKLDPKTDYISSHGEVQFNHAETYKTITVDVNKSIKTPKNFIIALRNASLGAKIGLRSAVVCHINKDEVTERIAELLDEQEEPEDNTWKSQFFNAMIVGSTVDKDGNEVPPKWNHYLMHFFTFFWKVLCACIPPSSCLGSWPAFVLSLAVIGLLTAFVEQLGHLLGCVVGLETSVTGITIIALGTSLPDTFASRTAARQDEYADAAIGNVTGSNSVNVFLGLGIPWVIRTIYAVATGTTFRVKTTNLTESVIIFSVCGTLCIFILLLRRKFVGGELGGEKALPKYLTGAFLVLLWVIYIVLSSLKAYNIIF